MADIYITEYRGLARGPEGELLPIPMEPAIAEQKVTFTTSTQSAAFNGDTRFVRLYCDVDAWVRFGTDPTAAVTSQKLPGGVEHYRGIQPGQSIEVAAYDGSS